MSWATHHIEKLQAGETVQFRPRGNSMLPKIKSGQLCTVVPADEADPGDVVLCRVKGSEYLHLVKAREGDRYLIGNNKGRLNGWTRAIFGKLVGVGD